MLPWDRILAQSATQNRVLASTAVAPDLPNFASIMDWIASDNAPRLSFLDAQWHSLEAWKAAARPVFHHHLSYQPSASPLGAELVHREPRDGYTCETVKIHATPAYHIPARVLIPTKSKGRLPAVVGMHCHSGRYTWGHEKVISSPDDSASLTEFRNGAYGRPWAETLVRRGYIVIISDAFYFGQRRLRVEDLEPERVFQEVSEPFAVVRTQPVNSPAWIAAMNRVCSFYEHLTAKTILAAGATWPGMHVWDDMRTVDYLASRPDVDAARLGCMGLSIGGLRTAHLISADARIKVASVTGWMTEFAQQLRNHARHTWMAFVPGLYRSLDLPDAVGLHAPGALLVQQCRRDKLYPIKAMESAVTKIGRIYAKAGCPERFRGTFYDEPHSFRPYMQEEAFEWLDRWL